VSKKIVIIGAGSIVFSSRLTADILSYPELADSEIRLVDVEPDRLNYAGRIANRIIKEGGYSKATVSSTLDRREALKCADFVIISILVGGYEAIEKEIDIPMKYGINQCIGDTLTPGGIMRCVRTLPILQEISHDIMELCPHALVLNYSNPMSMLTWGMLEAEPKMQLVGLCHSVQGTGGEWAKRLGIDFEDVTYECAGINHQAWFLKYEKDGEDLLPEIRKLALKPEIWYGDSTRMEYVKHFGFPVTESSGHVSEYNSWFRKNEQTIARYCPTEFSEWNGGTGFIKDLYARPDWKETMEKMSNWETPVSLERSFEYGSIIINSKVTGEKSVIYGNIKNEGLITNLPEECIVEVPVLVDKNGMRPIKIGALPSHLSAINQTQINVQQLAVEATIKADPEILFQAMAMDPLTSMSCTLDEIRAMTRELMEAHKEWIPVMRGRLPEDQPLVYLEEPACKVDKHIDPAEANKLD
jgi:alpha-galactosidase